MTATSLPGQPQASRFSPATEQDRAARSPATPVTPVTPEAPAELPAVHHPRLFVHLRRAGECERAQVEEAGHPGSLLGGPWTRNKRNKPGTEYVADDQAQQALHLEYLRSAYRASAGEHLRPLRAELGRLAVMHRYGRNRVAVLCDDPLIGENIVRAVLALAARLPDASDLFGPEQPPRGAAVSAPEQRTTESPERQLQTTLQA